MDDPVMLVRVTFKGEDEEVTVYHTGWTIARAMREWLCEGTTMEILSVYEYLSESGPSYDDEQEQRFHEAEKRHASCSFV